MDHEITMSLLDNALNKLRYYQGIVDDCNRQIDRLKKTYNELGDLRQSFRGKRNDTGHVFDSKVTWRGDTYASFCKTGDDLDGVCKKYYDNLDAARDEINIKIGRLNSKKWQNGPVVGQLKAEIEDIKASMKNVTN